MHADLNAASVDRPRLAITLGDPAGIGPEIVLRALSNPGLTQDCELTVVGSRSLLQETYAWLSQQFRSVLPFSQKTSKPLTNPDQFSVLDLDWGDHATIAPGMASATSGAASFAYLDQAIAQTLAGNFHGIVTGPIAKSAWKAAGQDYAGQTELLAERADVNQFGMLFVARSPYTGWTLRTLLATTHIPLRQVADTLTPKLLSAKLDLLVQCLDQDFGLKTPRIAIAGLNPHSGEQGQLGSEEKDWLVPWIEQARSQWPQILLEGPVPPDTLWVKPSRAWYGSDYPTKLTEVVQGDDAYLALYHDQGLIPVKLLAFEQAVNTTIGLPFVRTSPDHGTAFDIAGRGVASDTSIISAIQLAVNLVRQRLASTSPKHLAP